MGEKVLTMERGRIMCTGCERTMEKRSQFWRFHRVDSVSIRTGSEFARSSPILRNLSERRSESLIHIYSSTEERKKEEGEDVVIAILLIIIIIHRIRAHDSAQGLPCPARFHSILEMKWGDIENVSRKPWSPSFSLFLSNLRVRLAQIVPKKSSDAMISLFLSRNNFIVEHLQHQSDFNDTVRGVSYTTWEGNIVYWDAPSQHCVLFQKLPVAIKWGCVAIPSTWKDFSMPAYTLVNGVLPNFWGIMWTNEFSQINLVRGSRNRFPLLM